MTTIDREPGPGFAAQDARVAAALRMVEREQLSVLSLDVFDTLLWRVVPEPTAAFVLLGHRLRDAGQLRPHVWPEVFARLREAAEGRARRRALASWSNPEVSLEEIWQEMPAHLFADGGTKELAAAEVEFEQGITFPDLEVCQLARAAQERGIRLALVSDTYYGERQLRSLLDRRPLSDLDVRAVFCSSDHRANKGSGLYAVMLEALGVPAGRVLHVGDNTESDVACAAKEGIRTVCFDKYPAPLRLVFEREGILRAREADDPLAALDPACGDFGLTALRSKAVSRTEADEVPESVRPYWTFGALVLGPAFTAFAEWVHRRAREEGVTTVHCLMREGEFLARLVNGARGYLGSPVTAQTLWLSRQLCSRAAVFQASRSELSSVLNRRQRPTLREFLDVLGVRLTQLPELFASADGRLDDPRLVDDLFAAIERRPEVKATVVRTSAALRERLVTYVQRTLGDDAGRAVLVDVGWGGTIQANLDAVLRGSGVGVETLGLYLLTNQLALERMLDGLRAEGFLATGGFPKAAVTSVVRSPEIIEQVCMVDEGSLLDFTAEGEPVSGPARQSPIQMLQRAAVQRGILAFQREWGRYGEVVPVDRRTLDERARDMLLRMLFRFVVSPTTDEAAMFAGWTHDENFGSQAVDPVVAEEMAPHLRYMTPEQFLDLPMSKVYWPFGLASLHNPPLAAATAAIADGVAGPDAFASDEEEHVRLAVDSGEGFRDASSGAVRRNVNGLSYIRAEAAVQPIRALLFVLPPGVVRLDWMRLAFAVRGREAPVRMDLEWPEQFRDVDYDHCIVLAGNVLVGSTGAPHVAVRVPPEWAGDAYRVEVEAGFAWLRAAPVGELRPPTNAEVLVDAGRLAAGKLRRVWRSAEQTASRRSGTRHG